MSKYALCIKFKEVKLVLLCRYEDDEFVGHRLYREIRRVERKVEMKKGKTRGSHVLPSTTYEWETVATNLDEFLDVSVSN